MVLTTEPLDVDGLLCSWLPRTFDITTVAGPATVRDTITLSTPGWTDGRPQRVRDRAGTKLKLPYGTVTYLHSYGWTVWHTRQQLVERLVTRTGESLVGVAGEDTYQVRYRDIAEIVSVTVGGAAVTGTEIVKTKGYVTPDAIKLSAAATALVADGTAIVVTYKYKVFDAGSLMEGYEVYRLEGKTDGHKVMDGSTVLREYPASRVAKQWLDHMIRFMGANMQRPVAGKSELILNAAGDDMNGAGLLAQDDETETRFVLDLLLYRSSTVFTTQDIRRIGTWTLDVAHE